MAKLSGSKAVRAFRKPGASDFFELAGVWKDYPALILGGGPTLPAQFEAIPKAVRERAIKISVNQHGCLLTRCDYIVAMDNIPSKLEEDAYADAGIDVPAGAFDVPVISHQHWACHRLTEFWDAGNSAQTATWVAYELGCHPIILLGMDCYQGPAYWWNPAAHSPSNNSQLEPHLNSWRRVFTAVPLATVRAAGGPLVALFGEYDPEETPERKKQFEVDMTEVIGKRGRALSNFAHRGQHISRGQIVRFQSRDFMSLLAQGCIEEVPEDELRERARQGEPATKPRRASKRRRPKSVRDSGK